LLFWSGIAAGLSIGLSFLARATVMAKASPESADLLGNLLYPIGFVFIVLGRYQLFTENTLTPVTLVLTRIASIPLLLQVWGVVLFANVIGSAIIAYVLATTSVLEPEAAEMARKISFHALEYDWSTLFIKGFFAGWLVAGMVWLVHAARDTITRLLLVYVIMYLVPTADLFHCIIGASEVFYLVFQGLAGLDSFAYFFSAVVVGNTVGGVLLVALLNYTQTRETRFPDRDCLELQLTWQQWLFGKAAGRPRPINEDDQTLGDGALPRNRTAGHTYGEPNAKLDVELFGDYECPTSTMIYETIRRVQDAHPQQVRLTFRHMPLDEPHPMSRPAALAAEAAGRQGRFWPMHDRLMMHADALTNNRLELLAGEAGVPDMERFRADFESPSIARTVRADELAAQASGISSTRNLIINGVPYDGDWTPDAIEAALLRTSAEAVAMGKG
ncbi:MAG: formate/nitrite transporter family protein, partial [Bacteroidota bacterium]